MSTFLSPRYITLHLIVPLTCVSDCIFSHLLAYVPDPHLTISLSHRLTSAHRVTTVQRVILIGRHLVSVADAPDMILSLTVL
jgi:hypothetical protein